MASAVTHMLLASSFFSVMALGVKLVPNLPVLQVVFVRAVFSLLFCYGAVRRRGLSPWGTRRGWLLLRGGFGTIGLIAYFTTLQTLPLATAALLAYLAPLFTALIAHFALKDRLGRVGWLGLLLSFAGVLTLKGFTPGLPLALLLLGAAGALASACAYTCISKIRQSEDPQVVMFYFPLLTVPLVAPWAVAQWRWPSPEQWAILLMIAVSVQLAQYFMTLAYQTGPAGSVSAASYFGIVLAVVWDAFVFHVYPTLATILGALLVLGGVLLATYRPLTHPASRTSSGSAD